MQGEARQMFSYGDSVEPNRRRKWLSARSLLMLCAATGVIVLGWHLAGMFGVPDPIAANKGAGAAILDIGVLVLREGLECVLVLAAITASMTGSQSAQKRPVAAGAGIGAFATLATWFVAVRILNDLSTNVSALNLQAATGLLAIFVLLVVMNWFFHKVYWTGWISLHNRRKRELTSDSGARAKRNLLWGLGLLGFSSFYREGFEVVLFLQSYRLKLGGRIVLEGVAIGVVLSGIVAALTFVAHRKLPYRRMLVLTGIMLGAVLLVMVGEQVQEMQLAHWLPTHEIAWLVPRIPAWMGLWFSVFPNVESLSSQAIAFVLVVGSYYVAGRQKQPRLAV